ncbi:hypothetical protein K439DRAFT_1620548 [Ramaria rubella]|nr:hypothetical protein K439DRAFT_1620548 [Ramaria rubella]
MLSYLPTLPSRHRYKLIATLKGHQGAINSLALSMTGNVLASGGDGVKLWDIQSKTQLTALKQNLLARGPMIQMNICAMAWLWVIWSSGLRILEIMTYGIYCSKGNFEEIMAKRLGMGCKLTCITHDPVCDVRPRIAIATHNSMVQVWKVNARGTLHSVFSVQLNGTVPRAVGFADAFNKDAPNKEFMNKDVLVFGLFKGNMHVLRGDDGKVMVTHELGSRIGSAAISNNRNQCIINNTTDGFDLYWQVTFGEDGKVIVGGSDHGVAWERT